LATQNKELANIKSALDNLQSRLEAMSDDDDGSAVGESAPATVGTAAADAPDLASDPTSLALVRAGIAELGRLQQVKDFPGFFARLAKRTELRMLLVKRWASGLQVLMEENVTLPSEVKRRRSDGRAPIPVTPDDIFAAVGQEAVVYSGPVPVKHFPLDLTLLLGRGSRERRIVILPLPSRDQWNSFVYLDADRSGEALLTVVETLAQYALTRLKLINQGDRTREGRVARILTEELSRRNRNPALNGDAASTESGTGAVETPDPFGEDGPPAADTGAADAGTVGAAPATEPHDGQIHEQARSARLQAEEIVRKWEESVLNRRDTSARSDGESAPRSQDDALVQGFVCNGRELRPEDILRASGELPALPKAACHIMSVIEDPRTTATKLEKAIALDQALTAKVLRVANSPFYGAVREIKTVSEAIVRLGFVTIRNWALVTATKSVFLTPGSGILYQKIWRQSILSAMATQLAAQTLRQQDSESLFIGGLMQNIGQLVLARTQPEVFQHVLEVSARDRRPYYLVEREIMGFDHGELGALLIQQWNLSEELEEAVRWHHRYDRADARSARTAATIALGEEIATCTGAEPGEETLRYESSAVARYLKVSEEVYRSLTEQARGFSIDPAFFA
jgi:HD-like signal output (HDOD) protein